MIFGMTWAGVWQPGFGRATLSQPLFGWAGGSPRRQDSSHDWVIEFAIPLGDGLGIGFHPQHEGWQGAVLIENPLWATVTGGMPSWPGSR